MINEKKLKMCFKKNSTIIWEKVGEYYYFSDGMFCYRYKEKGAVHLKALSWGLEPEERAKEDSRMRGLYDRQMGNDEQAVDKRLIRISKEGNYIRLFEVDGKERGLNQKYVEGQELDKVTFNNRLFWINEDLLVCPMNMYID